MILRLTLLFLIATWSTAAAAADLGVPLLSDSKIATRFFDPGRLVTSGGIKLSGIGSATLEPQLGLGYDVHDQELGSGREQSVYKVHAQAGGKFDLGGTVFFSAAAKLPVYTYETTDRRFGGGGGQDLSSRSSYDITRIPLSSMKWTGEVGFRLGGQTELNIYYDQTLFDSLDSGPARPEERVGTRFIFRFN